ncbi:hypothetical protein [Methylobacterium sp. D54C]
MIPRSLTPDDFVWALDHSRRRFRVRETRMPELPSGLSSCSYITVVPLDGSRPVVMLARCGLFPHEPIDSDRYATDRLRAIRLVCSRRRAVR